MFYRWVPNLWVTLLGLGCGPLGSVDLDGAAEGFLSPTQAEVVEGVIALALDPGTPLQDHGVIFQAGGNVVDRDWVPPYEAWIDTATLPEGRLVATAVAMGPDQNKAAETEPLARVEVVVDNAGPRITIGKPDRVCFSPGQSITLFAEVTDDPAITLVEFRLQADPIAILKAPPYRVTHPIPSGIAQREFTFTVAAENSHQRVTSQSLSVPRCQ